MNIDGILFITTKPAMLEQSVACISVHINTNHVIFFYIYNISSETNSCSTIQFDVARCKLFLQQTTQRLQ